MTRHVEIGLSAAPDLDDLAAFYQAHPHPNYAFRAELTARYVPRGHFAMLRSDGALIGAAALFPSGEEAGGLPVVELGQVRVAAPGLGLYPSLVFARLLRINALYPAGAFVFLEIDEPNTAMVRLAEGCGFERFAPPPALYARAIESLPPDKRPAALGYDFVWFRAPPAAFNRAQDWAMGLRAGGIALPDGGRLTVNATFFERLTAT